jgi:hypothetical protein
MNLQGLSTSANLVLQQPGSAATGPATPAPADQAQAAEASGAAVRPIFPVCCCNCADEHIPATRGSKRRSEDIVYNLLQHTYVNFL